MIGSLKDMLLNIRFKYLYQDALPLSGLRKGPLYLLYFYDQHHKILTDVVELRGGDAEVGPTGKLYSVRHFYSYEAELLVSFSELEYGKRWFVKLYSKIV